MTPTTHYALSGDVNIAYQVLGEGPIDLIIVPGVVSHLDLWWEQPKATRFFERLASFSRLILFDKRGTGLSDRVQAATLEQRMDDVRAVLDAVGSKCSAVAGVSEGGAMAILFAATYPERTSSLILYGAYAKEPDYMNPEQLEAYAESLRKNWGSEERAQKSVGTYFAPSAANDQDFVRWAAKLFRQSSSPGSAVAHARMNNDIDLRDILPAIALSG